MAQQENPVKLDQICVLYFGLISVALERFLSTVTYLDTDCLLCNRML